MRNNPLLLIPAALLCLSSTALPAPGAEGGIVDSAVGGSMPADSTDHPEVILYYFHRTLRCHTCITLEALIEEELRCQFVDDLESGRLSWRPTDFEGAENSHFKEAFSLRSSAAILVRLDGNEVESWKCLDEIWDLLDSKEEFQEYIRKEVAHVLAEAPGR